MQGKPITILLIDDHPVVHSGYGRLFETTTKFRLIAAADNGKTGCVQYELHHPDVTIVDLNMPDIGGIETIRRIKRKNPDAKILVFSMDCNKILAKRAFDMGATGFLTKQSDFSQMTTAIQKVFQGQSYFDPILLEQIFEGDSSEKTDSAALSILSKREFQLFKLFSEGNSCAQVAEMISISSKTAGVHHANIMKKLKLQNPTQLVRMAIKHNIIQA